MNEKINDILMTLQDKLEKEANTIITEECLQEMAKILTTEFECREFSTNFINSIIRYNENKQVLLTRNNEFEVLQIKNKKDKKKKKGKEPLCSYKNKKKGKNNKNVRCIFITDTDTNKNIFLASFIEDRSKDYSVPIKRAIERYNEFCE